MFPRDRVIASLKKYKLPFEESMSDDALRDVLAHFYAGRTLTHQPIDPKDCAQAILFLAGPAAPRSIAIKARKAAVSLCCATKVTIRK
jgi:hypothetical protein